LNILLLLAAVVAAVQFHQTTTHGEAEEVERAEC
jgi:hypothetical protein